MCIIKFVHASSNKWVFVRDASRERNGDFDACSCMCVFYMADDVVALLIFCGLVNLKTLNIETLCIKNE